MKLGLVTDVHGDAHALQDALTQIERLGCDAVVCAGDLIDYGLFPEETIALLRERAIPCVRGNHDRWALGRGRADAPDAPANVSAYDASGWDLSRGALDFLASLPTSWHATLEGVRVAVHHARPGSDMDGIYPDQLSHHAVERLLDQADADILLVGHTHMSFVVSLCSRRIANPGALLRDPSEPMHDAMLLDRDTGKFVRAPLPGGGTFGVLDLPSRRFSVHRAADGSVVDDLLAFDVTGRSQEQVEAGLDDELWQTMTERRASRKRGERSLPADAGPTKARPLTPLIRRR